MRGCPKINKIELVQFLRGENFFVELWLRDAPSFLFSPFPFYFSFCVCIGVMGVFGRTFVLTFLEGSTIS